MGGFEPPNTSGYATARRGSEDNNMHTGYNEC